MSRAIPRATFRDPAGSLQLEENQAVRTIHESSRKAVLEFLASPFCARIQERGDLIGATVDDAPDWPPPAPPARSHPNLSLGSGPPRSGSAAAELTLNLGDEALIDGWILKDATPHNILFLGSRPVLVDILSFERRDPGNPVWLAYGQYVRTFLLPLLMNRMLSWPLTLTLFKRDGYEPIDLYRALSWRQRLSRAALWPISLPTWLEGKHGRVPARPPARKDPELALHILRKSLADLRKRTQRAVPAAAASEWTKYSGALTHYTAEEVAQKNSWLRETLTEAAPTRVLDVGANTGEYSVLATSIGAEVVALERDQATAERLYRMSVDRALPIQTIHADLARPNPAVGWENSESTALLPRLKGRFDAVLMLAVIHHLLLLEQIPLSDILALLHRLTTRWLVIEWVPTTDPMYISLMRGRDDLYGGINEHHLTAACEGRFAMQKRLTLSNGRILLLFEKV